MSNRALFEQRSPEDIEAARGGDRDARLRLLADFVYELLDGEPISPDLRSYFGTVLGSIADGKEPADKALGLRRPRGQKRDTTKGSWRHFQDSLALRAYDAAIKRGESHTKALEYASIETERLGRRIPEATMARLVKASGRRS